MPRKTYNTKADFDEDYRIGAEPEGHPNSRSEIKLSYNRASMMPYCERRADKLVEIFNWPLDTKILIVGAGFAWTAEILETKYNYTNIITTDTSDWIQSNQNESEESEVDAAITAVGLDPASGVGLTKKNRLHTPGNRRRHSRNIEDESLSNTGSRNRIKAILGDIDTAISEEVVTVLDDNEVLNIADWIERINANMQIIHLTTELLPNTDQDPRYNWKVLADWKAL
jgi:hypothetical protein